MNRNVKNIKMLQLFRSHVEQILVQVMVFYKLKVQSDLRTVVRMYIITKVTGNKKASSHKRKFMMHDV